MFFSIAMGQGIVAAPPIEVMTTPLLSCTFIAGRGHGTAGAFHYPARSLKEIEGDLNAWIKALQPTEMVFVFAGRQATMGYAASPEADEHSDTPLDDRKALRTWLDTCHKGMVAKETTAIAATMEATTAGVFNAGTRSAMTGGFDETTVANVHKMGAGKYKMTTVDVELFGHDHDQDLAGPYKPPPKPAGCCTIL